jgi:hypothetical protein
MGNTRYLIRMILWEKCKGVLYGILQSFFSPDEGLTKDYQKFKNHIDKFIEDTENGFI